MSSAYDAELRELANQVAVQLGMKSSVHEGVYFCQAGPCFETVAELRMIKYVGGDVIGKSAVTITSRVWMETSNLELAGMIVDTLLGQLIKL